MNIITEYLDVLGSVAPVVGMYVFMVLCLGYLVWVIYEIITAPIIDHDPKDPYQHG